jgi:LysR family transcriptional regulator, glycine cleavage system transcriptional activator
MARKLPPLNALKAFEATARHRSVKQAAEELNVTPAAVSHQIQLLESYLGEPLFRRGYRSIELTEAALRGVPKLQEGFESLREAIECIGGHHGGDVITIAGAPSFISQWLMLRLHRFVKQAPDIDVRVSTRMRPFARYSNRHKGDLESAQVWSEEFDVVIVFGNGNYPGLNSDRLMDVSVTPLCSPSLLEGPNPLRHPLDLRNHILLHDERGLLYEGTSFWDRWLSSCNVTCVNTRVGPHFTHAVMAIEAANAGEGVVATMPQLAMSELESKRLVAPFNHVVELSSSYYLVSSETASKRNIVIRFRQWLLEEAARANETSRLFLTHGSPAS